MKAQLRDDRAIFVGPNDDWTMGFGHDQLATGRIRRVLTTFFTLSRYGPVLNGRYSSRG